MDAATRLETTGSHGAPLWVWIAAVALAVGLSLLLILSNGSAGAPASPVRSGDTSAGKTVDPKKDYVLHPGGTQGVAAAAASFSAANPPCNGQC